jgi:hypothetical protein
MKTITLSHLKKHNKDMSNYKNDFPDAKLTCEETKEKIKSVFIEKYGVPWISSSQDIKKKKKETYQKNFGVDSPLQNKDILQKKDKTCEDRFGDKIVMRNIDVMEKYKSTCLEKFGEDCPFKAESVKEKIQEVVKEKYGVDYIFQSRHIKQKIRIKTKNNFYPSFEKQMKLLGVILLDNEYVDCYFKHNWACLKCGEKFIQIWNSIQQGYRCPGCFPRVNGVSLKEIEVLNYIRELLPESEILSNNKKFISPFEIDIMIPDKKICIEYNGLYFHSYDMLLSCKSATPEKYHLIKLNMCNDKGYRLISIFEDEWILKQDIVKARLRQILGKNISIKIHARQCKIKEIDAKTKNDFLEKFHLQGEDRSVIKLGAFYKDELVSVMTFSHGNISKGSKSKEGIWELSRFCSNYNYHIPGIASKLLTHFKRNYEWTEIFSYADRRWSDGNVYIQLGFELEHISKPNYWYIQGMKRIHRFNLRKRPDEPKDVSEKILRQRMGYSTIYDCGSLKFIMRRI